MSHRSRCLALLLFCVTLVMAPMAWSGPIRCIYGDNIDVEQTEVTPQQEFQIRIEGVITPFAFVKQLGVVTNIIITHSGNETILRFQGSFPQGTYHFGWWIDDCSLQFAPETKSSEWFETTLLATPRLIPTIEETGGQIFASFNNPGSGKIRLVRAGFVDRANEYPIEALTTDSLPPSSMTFFESGVEIPGGDSHVAFMTKGGLGPHAVIYVEAVFSPVTAYAETTRAWTAHAPPSAPAAEPRGLLLLGVVLALGSAMVIVRRRRASEQA